MGRKRRDAGSSLDLLLDTICNTFGGVVFIAILVVVLLRITGKGQIAVAPSADAQAELVSLDAQRETATSRLKTLREAAAQQERIIRQVADPENEALADEVKNLQSRRNQLDEQRLNSLGNLGQSQIKINEAAARLETLDRTLREAPKELAALEAELKAEVASRTQDARLPKQRDTDKTAFPLLLSGGRLHSVYSVSPDGSFIFNGNECEMTVRQGMKEVSPKPGMGLAIEDTDRSRQSVSDRLASVENDDSYLSVFVWPDSFARFRLLKDVMVSRQFEYRLVPMTDDAKVYVGVPSKSNAKVQ